MCGAMMYAKGLPLNPYLNAMSRQMSQDAEVVRAASTCLQIVRASPAIFMSLSSSGDLQAKRATKILAHISTGRLLQQDICFIMYRLRSYSDGQPVNIISWATSICRVTTKKLLRQRGTAVACMLHSFIFFFLCALLLYVISLAGWLFLSVLQPVHNDLWQCYVYYITILPSKSSSCIKISLCEIPSNAHSRPVHSQTHAHDLY